MVLILADHRVVTVLEMIDPVTTGRAEEKIEMTVVMTEIMIGIEID